MRKRTAIRWGVALGVLAVAFGHLVYWYWPREHAGREPSLEAARLYGAPGAELAAWIPYPHQNLGRLERFVGDVGLWSALLTAREARGAHALPRFGPLPVPPASELALAVGGVAEPPHAALRVYPSIARVARAAGRLADNPWLAGGVVDEPTRRAVVWQGDLWRFEPGGEAGAGVQPERAASAGTPEVEARTLGWVRSTRDAGPLPPGSYRLLRAEAGIELRLGPTLTRERPAFPAGAPLLALRIERTGRGELAMVLVWEDEGAVPPIPAAAVIVRGGAARPGLLGEELMRLAGRKPYRTQVGPFEISALRDTDLERARALLPELRRLASGSPGPRFVGVVDPAAALRAANRLRGGLGGFALAALFGVDPGQWADLLGPWQACGPIAVVVGPRGEAVRAWLCPPDGAPR